MEIQRQQAIQVTPSLFDQRQIKAIGNAGVIDQSIQRRRINRQGLNVRILRQVDHTDKMLCRDWRGQFFDQTIQACSIAIHQYATPPLPGEL
jgi:hypothetical protein